MTWRVVYTKQAQRDTKKLAAVGLRSAAEKLLAIIRADPWQKPPPFVKLRGDLAGTYSRRINIQHRLIYEIIDEKRIVKIIRIWTYYE